MALSIGVVKGSCIEVDSHVVQVKAFMPPDLIVISVDLGAHITVRDDEGIEILPDVFVSVGKGQNYERSRGHRLAFRAPKSIRISRTPTGPERYAKIEV